MTDTAVVFDPFAPEFHEDPYPTWTAIRESGELVRDAIGIYVVTRYEDVWSLLRDRRVGRDLPYELTKIVLGDGAATERFVTNNLMNYEGPEHLRQRRLMSKPFTPARIRDLEDSTEAIVKELLDAVDDEFDVAEQFSAILPVLVICDLLGLPREDRVRVKPWATTLTQSARTPEAQAAADEAFQNFHDYFEELLREKRHHPDGLLAALAAVEDEGSRLSHDELIENATLLFFAGHETTTNLIGNGVVALIDNPRELARLHRDPTLIPSAVEEMLRYDPPVQTMPRITHEAIDLSIGAIKAGRVMTLSFAAANRDPRAFRDPDTFDVGRTDNHHVGFGNGTHFCLGAHLARLETRLAFEELLRRSATFEIAGDYVRKPVGGLRGFNSLPVRVTRR
jgi:cytochrome P450